MPRRSPSSTIVIKVIKIFALALLVFLLLTVAEKSLRSKTPFSLDYWLSDALGRSFTAPLQHHSPPTPSPTWMNAAGASAASATPSGAATSLTNFTVVTAYFNIGQISKGSATNRRNSSTYLNWMQPYRLIQNGVVAYFDDAVMAAAFRDLRRGLPTKVITVNRSELWAFTLLNRTRIVFSTPGYPKNHPKSTSAEYVAAMHAKYELLARAVHEDDSFGSSYVAWMDLGIYRTLAIDANSTFMLRVHRCLHPDAIMFARIYPMVNNYTVQTVMRFGHDWVGGGFFLARRDVMAQFCAEYSRCVESYLNHSLANHDQSVLLAMYLPGSAPRPSVPLQAIVPSGADNPWFYLALQARREALAAPSDGLPRSDSGNVGHVSTRVSCSYEVYS